MKGLLILGIAILLLVSAPVTGCANKEQLSEAYNEGYKVGNNEGYRVGNNEGYRVGYNEGYRVGYNEGHVDVEKQPEEPTYGNIFFFYYTPLIEQQYGVEKLEECLDMIWKEGAYKADIFDCSEMSAFVEWYLENEGWHTKIKTGESPDGSGNRHAWLLVETSKGKYIPVEATQWSIVYWDNPYFENYFNYALRSFETIQEALKYSPTGFDWWASSD